MAKFSSRAPSSHPKEEQEEQEEERGEGRGVMAEVKGVDSDEVRWDERKVEGRGVR